MAKLLIMLKTVFSSFVLTSSVNDFFLFVITSVSECVLSSFLPGTPIRRRTTSTGQAACSSFCGTFCPSPPGSSRSASSRRSFHSGSGRCARPTGSSCRRGSSSRGPTLATPDAKKSSSASSWWEIESGWNGLFSFGPWPWGPWWWSSGGWHIQIVIERNQVKILLLLIFNHNLLAIQICSTYWNNWT